jgi:hypothetical protein
MTARGQVQNGVIVLEQGIRFPEGQQVIVTPSEASLDLTASSSTRGHSLLDIPPTSLGTVLRDSSRDDDLLDEMLADRS